MQWLDDLDDIVSLVRLKGERIRNYVAVLVVVIVSLLAQLAGIWLALRHPPLASAAAILLFVGLLYHSVTRPQGTQQHPV